jgi:Winged helix DNA-binding domain
VLNPVLSRRALNRATLARQLLLRRSGMAPLEAIEHLVGLQAQEPRDPYTALWSRLDGFSPSTLSELLESRQVVRLPVMRATVHLVTADDCLHLRPAMQPVLDAELARHPEFGPPLRNARMRPVLAYARKVLEEKPRSGRELRALLADRFPGEDAAALAYACRNRLALVQVPPRGLWGRSAQVATTTAEAWLGRPLVQRPPLEEIALRYFAAFGPATVADLTAWCHLTGLRSVVERVRPRLRTFHDENGRELFDLPNAPRPDSEMPAPVRFLPEYDNVLLSHADRSRFHPGREWLGAVQGRIGGTVLVDGLVRCVWRIDDDDGRSVLVVQHEPRMPKRAQASVAAEGRRYLRFARPDASERDVRLTAAV